MGAFDCIKEKPKFNENDSNAFPIQSNSSKLIPCTQLSEIQVKEFHTGHKENSNKMKYEIAVQYPDFSKDCEIDFELSSDPTESNAENENKDSYEGSNVYMCPT